MAKKIKAITLADLTAGNSRSVNWFASDAGTLEPGMLLDDSCNVFSSDAAGGVPAQSVRVDLAQRNGMSINWCRAGFFDGNFEEEEPVLWAVNSSQVPIQLFFDPPVRAVGAQVAADGTLGEQYFGIQLVSLSDDGTYELPTQVAGTLSKVRGSAPWMGVKGTGTALIHAVAFDVIYAGREPAFPHIGINSLQFIPA